jgi:hypothetical protein
MLRHKGKPTSLVPPDSLGLPQDVIIRAAPDGQRDAVGHCVWLLTAACCFSPDNSRNTTSVNPFMSALCVHAGVKPIARRTSFDFSILSTVMSDDINKRFYGVCGEMRDVPGKREAIGYVGMRIQMSSRDDHYLRFSGRLLSLLSV